MLRLCIFALLSSFLMGHALAAPSAREALHACQLSDGSWLKCPERAKGIKSFYALKKSPKAGQSKSALVLLAGGPGQSATEAFFPLSQLLGDLARDNDLIFFDPRGTALPSRLTCPIPSSKDLSILVDRSKQIESAINCVQSLGKKWDLNQFGTDLSVNDLEQIRAELGYEKFKLYGISYGTRLALRYATLYPEHVESVVLEGILPPEALIGADTFYLEPVLNKIAERCRLTASCLKTYGDPARLYQRIKGEYAQGRSINVAHPLTGEIQSLVMTSTVIDSLLLSLLYSEFDHSLIPALLARAADGHFESLLAAGFGSSRSSQSEALYYAIACTEDVPFYQAKHKSIRTEGLSKICEAYPFKSQSVSFHEPAKAANYPVLMLSGELDPVTAPSLVAELRKTFPHATQMIVKGKGHNVSYLPCVIKRIKAFVNDNGIKSKGDEILPEALCPEVALPFLQTEVKP